MARSRTRIADVAPDVAGPRLVMLVVVLGLTLLGFVMIYSASSISAITEEGGDQASYLISQLVYAVIGIAAGFALWKLVPYEFWATQVVWGVWGVAVVLLLMTAVSGTSALGAQRWLVLGPISLQPSEFVKIALVLVAAFLFSNFRMGALASREFGFSVVLLVVLPTAILYFTQSDLGTTVIIAVGILAVMWFGEAPLNAILAVIGGLVVFAFIAIVGTGYRSGRLLFLDPWNDGEGGQGNGYQLVHSYYAISEGGIFGVGLGNSREKFLYLPESETDFIFSIICEELGMLGALAVIAAFLALLWAGMRIARAASGDYGSMLAGALTVMLVFQAFLNIGCAIGVFPTTGKPLPFISSGGSSLIASFMMVGLVLAVSEGSSSDAIAKRRRDDLKVVRVKR